MNVVLEEIIAGSHGQGHSKRRTGMEGVLVGAKVASSQTLSWWEDWQKKVDRTFFQDFWAGR